MATCPSCLAHHDDTVARCPVDGTTLVPDEVVSSADRDLPVGAKVGDYVIDAKLGQGGFGAVYRATHPLIGKQVAIKVLARALCGDAEMLSRFAAEARVVNEIRSRYIVDIFGYGALPDGRQYYVMELLSGVGLDGFLKLRRRLAIEEAVPILKGIARAVDAAHGKGVVHRDLKPENVYLVTDEDGQIVPKLLDFGIAKLLGGPAGAHKTRTGVPMGTPYYMSPEQCLGEKVDARTDVYAFGVLAFEALTGALPFNGDSVMKILMAHTTQDAPRPSEQEPDLPAALDAPLLAMLAKDPEKRPASCGLALEALVVAARQAGIALDTLPVGTPGLLALAAERAQASSSEPDELARTAAAVSAPDATGGASVRVKSSGRVDTGGTPATFSGGVAATSASSSEASVAPSVRSDGLTSVKLVLAAAVLGLVALGVGLGVGTKGSAASSATTAASSAGSTAPSTAGPATASASASSAPVAPARVSLSVASEPREVEVFLGDRRLGKSTEALVLERGDARVSLVLKAEGHLPETIEVLPTGDVSISAKLKKAPSGVGAPGKLPVAPAVRPKLGDDIPSDVER